MPYDNSPLMHVIDLISPYMPASLSDPLYTLASLDFASLASNPSQLLPLALSLLAGYTAFLSFLSSARFAFRTAISLAKWGSIAAVLSAIYLGYNGAGTDRGVSGGVQDAAGYATGVGKTLYSLGRHGANWWFASNGQNPNAASSWLNSAFGGGSGTSTTRNRQARERRRRESTSTSSSRNTRNSYRSNEDPSAGAQAAQDFVGQAFGSVLEFLNPAAAGNAAKNGKTGRARRAAEQPAAADAGGSSGFGWLSGMAQAKKAWDEMTAGGSGAANGGRNRNR
ncbi:hypothetical protein BMF94_0394 [Rhodotorula taiwanensis]|uniref:Uncharacterized protein n=1 Tax=Rhodotorula taiwanensis TaxID=741276 RepID=A0A2S5BII2_9BASI|nr:hypothetical protein BMF94_0394 [Rhodotorula taiwanensis]